MIFSVAPTVHHALDRLLALAEQQGFRTKEYLSAGPNPLVIRSQFEQLGLDPIQEVVDFFSWHSVIHPRGSAPLFWEAEYWPFERMLQTYRENRRLAPDAGLHGQLLWPGPPTWFPVLMTDPSEIVAVECGQPETGSVWFAFTQDTPFKMYSSLGSAIAAAQRAVQSGAWWFDSKQGIMRANRNWMPWPGDRDPWAEPNSPHVPR